MKDTKKQTIAVGMSGGVDSSIAAALLKSRGHDVFGITARTWPSGSRCCADEDVQAARKAAELIGVDHHVVDLMRDFERDIVRQFAAEYAAGRTPSPCARCNPLIKFGVLLEKALELGADAMATGHYARIERDQNGVCHLLCGADPVKDQSYFLFGLSQRQLRLTRFPLADMTKDETKEMVERFGLRQVMAGRAESQDLCFVKPGEHWKLTEAYHPALKRDGCFVDVNGNELGRHQGIHRYTIGQRRGLGVAAAHPLYVAEIQADTGNIVLAKREELMRDRLRVKNLNWIAGAAPENKFSALAKIRYNHKPAEARIALDDDENGALVEFAEPQFAVAPGQAAVFYKDDELIGGGWIQ